MPVNAVGRLALIGLVLACADARSASAQVALPSTIAPGACADNQTLGAGDGTTECVAPSPESVADGRDAFSASGYAGAAFDNFAPGAIGGYGADSQAGAAQKRFIGGANFEFHVAGRGSRQLWIFGETLNGVRAADVECTGTDAPVVCQSLVADTPEQFRYILENASSKEVLVGARFELARLNVGTAFASRFYVTGQLGVMMLRGDVIAKGTGLEAQHAYRAHHVGVGLLIESGHFESSYLEGGLGRTDLFGNTELVDGAFVELNPWRRIKVDALLSFPMSGALSARWPRPFIQLFADFDPTGKTADSIQTFLGVDFDLEGLFK